MTKDDGWINVIAFPIALLLYVPTTLAYAVLTAVGSILQIKNGQKR